MKLFLVLILVCGIIAEANYRINRPPTDNLLTDARLQRISHNKERDSLFMKHLANRRQKAFDKAFREYHQMRMQAFKPK